MSIVGVLEALCLGFAAFAAFLCSDELYSRQVLLDETERYGCAARKRDNIRSGCTGADAARAPWAFWTLRAQVSALEAL
jgi:hypothetical protein